MPSLPDIGTYASAQLIGIVSNLFWSHLHTHAAGELFCIFQPTAIIICLQWSSRLKECFAPGGGGGVTAIYGL